MKTLLVVYAVLLSAICLAKEAAYVRVSRSTGSNAGEDITLHIHTEDTKHKILLQKPSKA